MESQLWGIIGVFALGMVAGSKLQSEATKWKDDFLPWNARIAAPYDGAAPSEHESVDQGLVEKEQRVDD